MMARASASESDDGTMMGGGAFWPSAGCAMQSDSANNDKKVFMRDLPWCWRAFFRARKGEASGMHALMVRSVAQRRVSNHGPSAQAAPSWPPSSFETHAFAMRRHAPQRL